MVLILVLQCFNGTMVLTPYGVRSLVALTKMQKIAFSFIKLV